jgi:hypothetical protein
MWEAGITSITVYLETAENTDRSSKAFRLRRRVNLKFFKNKIKFLNQENNKGRQNDRLPVR